MEVMYRPLLPPTQYCPCDWRSAATELNSLPHSPKTSPFFRSLFAPFSPLWVNQNPATTDNSPDISAPSDEPDINNRAIFERQRKLATRSWDSTAMMTSLYIPRGRWLWTHQVPFEDRPEEVLISHNPRYTFSMRTAKIYQENITYIRKLWTKGCQWDGFAREVMLHKTQLRPIHGALVPSLIGIHTNIDGIQMTYDIPHHSFWIQASPDMPDILKRRCLEAYSQLHAQGVLHGSVELENILIGGDGRVKIINFDHSRSGLADPRVQLHQATLNDFKMEMREVHYKLDYMQARRKERMAWENRKNSQTLELPTPNRSKIHDRPPYTVSLEPPVDPDQWSLPHLWSPKRFIVPGQSVEQFEHHLRQFVLRIDEEAGEGLDPPKFGARKRKRHNDELDSADERPSSKRVRFLALTWLDDGTTREMRSPPPPGVRRVVPRISRNNSTDIQHPVDSDEGNLRMSSIVYPRSLPTSCPRLSPVLDQQEFISAWKSARDRRSGLENSSTFDGMGNNEGPSERARGKRRQVDVDQDDVSSSQDGPCVKRLRRTETTILGPRNSTDDRPSVSGSTSHTPLPRYNTRSSSTRTQGYPWPGPGQPRSSSSRSTRTNFRPAPSRTTELTPQHADIGSIPSPPPSSSSSGRPSLVESPTPGANRSSFSNRQSRVGTADPIGALAVSDSIDQASYTDSVETPTDTQPQHIPSISDCSDFVFSFQNPALTPELTGQARDAMNELISATAMVNNSRSHVRGLRPTRDSSFGPIVIFFDPSLTTPQSPSSGSTSNAARSIAGQLPSTIRTVASTIARTFGFGLW